MKKNKKNNDVDKLVAERVNKALEKFSEYLGSTFHKLVPSEKINNMHELYVGEKIHLVKIDEVKDKFYMPIDLMGNNTAYTVYILFKLIKDQILNEDIDKREKIGTEFWIAGLPFNFNIESFVKEYLGKTSAIRLMEILELIGIKKKTYGPYFSYRKGEFNEEDLPELIIDVFNKDNKDTLTVNRLKVALGIDRDYLLDYLRDKSDLPFTFSENETKIVYTKPTS